MGIRVGIDLGTTFSLVSRINVETGKPEVIKNSFGNTTTPSVLCFESRTSILFGDDAKNKMESGDTNTVAFFKKQMGNAAYSLDFFGKRYSAKDLSSIFLKMLIEEAQVHINEKIEAAVITVPAYFTDAERKATKKAGEEAGIKVIGLINEPTSAVFAYGLNEIEKEQTVLIYDLGGGTFDVTVAKVNQNEIEVLGSDGNHNLGGKNWDDCLCEYLIREFNERHNVDINEEPEMASALLVMAESVKRQLSSSNKVDVPIRFKDIRDSIEVTHEIFDSVTQSLLDETMEVTHRLLLDENVRRKLLSRELAVDAQLGDELISALWKKIDGVILVGGSTKMRMINDYVIEMSGKPPLSGVSADEAVALGAAIRANITEKGKNEDDVLFLKGAKSISDVTAHSLGMIAETPDRERYINDKIIIKNSKIPAVGTRTYKFYTGNKNELDIYVLQGEFDSPLDNLINNKYTVTGIQKTNPAQTEITVSYAYTADGIIEVTAKQQGYKQSLSIRVETVEKDLSWAGGSPKDRKEPGNTTKNSKKVDMDVVLYIDLSGSMYGKPVEEAKRAMQGFVDKMDSKCTKIGLVIFADRSKTSLKPTNDFKAVSNAINLLQACDPAVGGGNDAEPFTLSQSLLSKKSCYIVVLTDGVWSNQANAIDKAKTCHKKGVNVIALGFGHADYNFLEKIASEKDFATLTDLSGLGESFSRIAQVIGNNSTGIIAE